MHSSIIRRFDNLCLLACFRLTMSRQDCSFVEGMIIVISWITWPWCRKRTLERYLVLSYGIIPGVDNRDNIFIDGKRSKGDAKQRERFVFKIKYYLYLYAAYRRVIFYPSSLSMTRESQPPPWPMSSVARKSWRLFFLLFFFKIFFLFEVLS